MSTFVPSPAAVYLYMLFCQDTGPIYVKIGISEDPIKRRDQIRTGCPIKARFLWCCALWSRKAARHAESRLHAAYRGWRSEGEWFKIERADKQEFNRIWKQELSQFARPTWPVRWTKITLSELEAQMTKRWYPSRYGLPNSWG